MRQDKKKGYLAVRRQKIKEQGGLKCNYCDLKFKCDITLKTHESKVHVGPKYTCDICGYGSAFKHTIIKHQEIHQEVVPKVCCQECGEMVRPGSLNSHYKRRHGG